MKIKKIAAIASAAACLIGSVSVGASAKLTPGDTDRNESISADDARYALRASVGLEQPDALTKILCDVDFDNEVTSSDARLILRISVGLETAAEYKEVFNENGEAEAYHQTVSSDGKIRTAEHVFTEYEAVINDDGVSAAHKCECVLCGAEFTEDHTPGEKVIVQQGSCVVSEISYTVCTVCGYKTEEVTNAEHHYEEAGIKESTCAEEGAVTYVCSVCGDTQIITTAKLPHTTEGNQTCTQGVICTVCGEEISPALGHDLPEDAAMKLTEDVCCRRCGEVVIPSFNKAVNTFKMSGKNKYSALTQTSTTFNEPQFSGSLALAVKAAFGQEFKNQIGTTTSYSPVTVNAPVSRNGFPIQGADECSLLEDKNVKSIKTEKTDAVGFLPELPDSYTASNKKECDLTKYKAYNFNPAYKVTVVLNSEKYSELQNEGFSDGISKIYAADYGASLNDSMRDLQADDSEFAQISGDITSDCTVEYYFDENFVPVAATYHVSMVMDEKMTIDIKIGNCTIKFNIPTEFTTWYMFNCED